MTILPRKSPVFCITYELTQPRLNSMIQKILKKQYQLLKLEINKRDAKYDTWFGPVKNRREKYNGS